MNDTPDDLFSWNNKRRVPASEIARLVLESKEPCKCCGEVSALNPHRLDKQKIAVLLDLAVLLATNGWVRVEEGREIQGCDDHQRRMTSYRARVHVSRLAWFGLAVTQDFRSSNWRLTRKGADFLQGKIAVPRVILCRGGRVIHETIETVQIHEVTDTFDKEYWDNYPWAELELAD